MDIQPRKDSAGDGHKRCWETDRWTYSQDKTVLEMDTKDNRKQTDGHAAKTRQSGRWT